MLRRRSEAGQSIWHMHPDDHLHRVIHYSKLPVEGPIPWRAFGDESGFGSESMPLGVLALRPSSKIWSEEYGRERTSADTSVTLLERLEVEEATGGGRGIGVRLLVVVSSFLPCPKENGFLDYQEHLVNVDERVERTTRLKDERSERCGQRRKRDRDKMKTLATLIKVPRRGSLSSGGPLPIKWSAIRISKRLTLRRLLTNARFWALNVKYPLICARTCLTGILW